MNDQQPPPRRVEWRRVIAEGVAIVVSILLAFGIEAWWSGQQDRAEERELLAGLRAELLENRERLSQEVETVRQARARLSTFSRMSPQDAERLYSDSAYASVIMPLRRSYTNELTHGFLTATVNSGRLALIRDASLRAALGETESLDQDAGEIRTVLADLAQRGVLATSS